jgi:hypothetical protein
MRPSTNVFVAIILDASSMWTANVFAEGPTGSVLGFATWTAWSIGLQDGCHFRLICTSTFDDVHGYEFGARWDKHGSIISSDRALRRVLEV